MRIQYISLGLIFLALFVCVPHHAAAYFTTNQTAVKLSDTAALFMIECAFGLKDHDIYMPVIAQRGLSRESHEQKVGYTFREDTHAIDYGTSAGLVVSNAPIEQGMYKIEKGTAQTMTLFVLLTTNENTPHKYYTLQVDRLPYYVDRGETTLQELQLNPTELQYYVTKEVELNAQ